MQCKPQKSAKLLLKSHQTWRTPSDGAVSVGGTAGETRVSRRTRGSSVRSNPPEFY